MFLGKLGKTKKYITIGNEIFLILDEIDESFVDQNKSTCQGENFNNTKTETKKSTLTMLQIENANEGDFQWFKITT